MSNIFNTIDFSGIVDILRIPIAYILQFCYWICHNYMLALILFAVVMQLILLPFAIKQQKNSIKQAKLQPKIMAIRNKYKGRDDKVTQQKMQQETMDLYQKENFNPAGGCLPLLIQFPIIFALFRVITQPLHYLCGLSVDAINALQDAAKNAGAFADRVVYPQLDVIKWLTGLGESGANSAISAANVSDFSFSKLPDLTVFGGKIDLSQAPSAYGVKSWMILIPIVTVVALIFSQWLTKKFTYQAPETQDAQNNASMKIMLYAMPLLSGYFAYLYAAALGIYWIFRNLLGLVQQIILAKVMPIPRFTEEDYKAAEKEMFSTRTAKKKSPEARDPSKPKPRSLHHIDDDDEDEYVDNGRVSRYDTDDDTDGKDKSDASERSVTVSDGDIAPLKEDKGTKYRKK